MQLSINFYKMTVLFWHPKNKINGRGEAPIYCRITVNGERVEFSTNIFCKPDFFDAKKQILKDEVLNLALVNIKQKANAIYLDMSIKEKAISPKDIKDYLTGKRSMNITLMELFKLFKEYRHTLLAVNEIFYGTYKKTEYYINAITEFLKVKKLIKITPGQFNGKLGNELYYWLQTEQKKGTMHAARTLGFLKSVLNYGLANELCSANHLQYIKFKRGAAKKIEFLEPEEVEKLKKHEFASLRLQEVADLFLFQCYTGLSYADLEEFDPLQHIETDKKGRQWIIKDRSKNGHESVLPYSEKAKAIVQKYYTINILNERNFKLPVITNQKYNAYLKEIKEIIGFEINLTTHIGRKTFGTIALNDGYSIESVSRMLGHTNISTTQKHYAVVLRKRVGNEG